MGKMLKLIVEHLEHLDETKDLFGNLAKSLFCGEARLCLAIHAFIWEGGKPPHSCAGRSASARHERVSTLITRLSRW
jgi:hypothetical protein